MAKKLKFFLVLFIFLANPVFSQQEEFFFSGFRDAANNNNMSLNGAAEIEKNGKLMLTNTTLRVLGHAFYSSPIKFKNSTRNNKSLSFSTCFAFAIVPEYTALGGHGFAFTISASKELPGTLPSQYLGLLNSSDLGNLTNHIFAVEFDTVKDFEFGDINDNHVGIDINSLRSNASEPAAYFLENSTKQVLNLKSGEVIQAWIDYDSSKNHLEVRLAPSSVKPRSPILSFDVDLSPIVKETMYVGFSSSTGCYLVKKIRNADVLESWELDVGPHRFSYEELKKATRGFRDKELLGFGGFGRVYKGTLPSTNTQVAVKRVSNESKQGLREFASEISSIGRLRHRNLVQLLGWCRLRGDLLLVYDFMPNGSLDKHLFDEQKAILTWEQRYRIIKGVASGLLYLHEEWEQTVIHRDIKAGNVLLDSELNGRLGDFGLAKLYERGTNPSTTRVVGTLGYLAPELTRTGKPTTSSDVYAFGALLLEVVCGRRPIEPKALPEELILVDWVWDRWKAGAILEVVDPRLNGEFNEIEALDVVKLGLMCSNDAAEARPTMRQVVRYLEGEVPLPQAVAAPDACDGKKEKTSGGGAGVDGPEFEDFVHSYPNSSFLEKVSNWSSAGDDADVDIEAGSSSPLSGRGG